MKLEAQEYLKNSTIHGLAYISRRLNISEIIFWTVSLFLSAILTLVLIIQLVTKLNNFPIVVYLSDISIPISEINFPAVTVCPELIPYRTDDYRTGFKTRQHMKYEKHTGKSYYLEDFEYLQETEDERLLLKNVTILRFNYYKFLDQLEKGKIDPNTLGQKLLKRLQVIDLVTKRGVFNKLNFSVPTDDFLEVFNDFQKQFLFMVSTMYFGWLGDFMQHVTEILTPYGLCFTFNLAMAQDSLVTNLTSDDFHYQLVETKNMGRDRPGVKILPRRTSIAMSGLFVHIHINYAWHKMSYQNVISSDIDGFVFMFHDPYELPSIFSKIFLLNKHQDMEILIEPLFYSIDGSIIEYDIKDRNCYLDDERKLKYFKKYTKANCIQECLSDFMISRCECVEFYMIRNSTTRTCRGNEKNCFDNARNEFENHQNSCGCLQPCFHLQYDFELSITNHPNNMTSLKESENTQQSAWIKFKDKTFNELIRKQQFDVIDFLSFVGGLLGLFAGFSVLSLVEFIYWFSIRLILAFTVQNSNKVTPINEQPKQSEKRNLKIYEYFVEYFKESTIHGLQFLTSSRIKDRILWIYFLLFSMTACFLMMTQTREKLPDSRVIAFDDNLKFIDNITFPALTVVPEFTSDLEICSAYYLIPQQLKILEQLKKFPKSRNEILTNTTKCQFCSGTYVFSTFRPIYDLKPFVLDILKASSKRDWFLQQIATWDGGYDPVFAEIRTNQGMGFSFNILDAEKLLNFKSINQDFRFYKNLTTKNIQNSRTRSHIMTVSNGRKATFHLKLQKHISKEVDCIPLGIAVHAVDIMPTFLQREDFISLRYGMELDIEVTPEIIRTDENLKQLSSQTRECYFDGEKKLKFFKKYSQQNCIVECLADFIYESCNCSEFTHPFKQPKFCSQVNKILVYHCPVVKRAQFFEQDVSSTGHKCSCLPTCNSMTYHIRFYHKIAVDSEVTIINLRMNTEDAILYRRYQQFTFSDIVSYVGGLLGLFAGISVLSIVEIFYFFVIRVAVNMFRV